MGTASSCFDLFDPFNDPSWRWRQVVTSGLYLFSQERVRQRPRQDLPADNAYNGKKMSPHQQDSDSSQTRSWSSLGCRGPFNRCACNQRTHTIIEMNIAQTSESPMWLPIP